MLNAFHVPLDTSPPKDHLNAGDALNLNIPDSNQRNVLTDLHAGCLTTILSGSHVLMDPVEQCIRKCCLQSVEMTYHQLRSCRHQLHGNRVQSVILEWRRIRWECANSVKRIIFPTEIVSFFSVSDAGYRDTGYCKY